MGRTLIGIVETSEKMYRPFITFEQDQEHVEFFCSLVFKEEHEAKRFIESVYQILFSENKREIKHIDDGPLPMPLFHKETMI